MAELHNAAEIKSIVAQLERNYDPELIMIFGSYSKGTVHSDSDLDLLIVKNTTKRPIWRKVEARKSFKTDIPIDLIVYNPEEFSQLKKRSLFIKDILKNGKVVSLKRNDIL